MVSINEFKDALISLGIPISDQIVQLVIVILFIPLILKAINEIISSLYQTAAAHPRSRAAGYARRRRIKMLLIRSEPFLSRTRMHFIPAAELRGITDK
jgi:hypothetical protein